MIDPGRTVGRQSSVVGGGAGSRRPGGVAARFEPVELTADGFLTDEFGGTNFALVHAALQGPRIVPTPRLLCDCARNGHIAAEEARRLVTTISPHRNWENSSYVAQLLAHLE